MLRRADQEALANSKRQLIRWKASFDKAVAAAGAIPDEIHSDGIDGHYQLGPLREMAHVLPTKQAARFDEALETLLLNLTDLQSESYRDPQAPEARLEAFKAEVEEMSEGERTERYKSLKNEELAMGARLMREGEELNALVKELSNFDPSRRFARTMEEEARVVEGRDAEGETEGKEAPAPKQEERTLAETMAQMEAEMLKG
ncbi:hypothetical protein BDY17DRAFT_322639 [Neohortaea acidophila]|uniref:Uncharacterized protein n=1 Tax=Neohortaea acidophila TaxID=245834 RepID=A0A6A6Q096_9PEZI|nr:uncharacterized protein BDY17DRAFT_322639 [Neohortaea acidophila]KAF2485830.1 hypothetical protein BDY17DRAFT_322639 [Neohortaea acidophila]